LLERTKQSKCRSGRNPKTFTDFRSRIIKDDIRKGAAEETIPDEKYTEE